MEIEVRPVEGATLVVARGRVVDGEPGDKLRKTLQELIQRQKVRTIIDLGGVTWFDSIGVGILVSHYVSVTSRSGAVVLLNVGPKIQTVLDITLLSDRFPSAESLEEAIELVQHAHAPGPDSESA